MNRWQIDQAFQSMNLKTLLILVETTTTDSPPAAGFHFSCCWNFTSPELSGFAPFQQHSFKSYLMIRKKINYTRRGEYYKRSGFLRKYLRYTRSSPVLPSSAVCAKFAHTKSLDSSSVLKILLICFIITLRSVLNNWEICFCINHIDSPSSLTYKAGKLSAG